MRPLLAAVLAALLLAAPLLAAASATPEDRLSAVFEAIESNPPVFWGPPLEDVQALNEQLCTLIKYDDAYFARSLARKNNVPFVM